MRQTEKEDTFIFCEQYIKTTMALSLRAKAFCMENLLKTPETPPVSEKSDSSSENTPVDPDKNLIKWEDLSKKLDENFVDQNFNRPFELGLRSQLNDGGFKRCGDILQDVHSCESSKDYVKEKQRTNTKESVLSTSCFCHGDIQFCQHPGIISVPDSGSDGKAIISELCHDDLWVSFHRLGTEMIITKSGRRMFPSLKLRVTGLDPDKKYIIRLEFEQPDSRKYRYIYHSSRWVVSGSGDALDTPPVHQYPEGPISGQLICSQIVSFERLKLTNSNSSKPGQVSLVSMQKFQPRVVIEEVKTADSDVSHRERYVIMYPQTSFMAVTAYQNQQITTLKIASNPFAKGFRESGKARLQYESLLTSCSKLMYDGPKMGYFPGMLAPNVAVMRDSLLGKRREIDEEVDSGNPPKLVRVNVQVPSPFPIAPEAMVPHDPYLAINHHVIMPVNPVQYLSAYTPYPVPPMSANLALPLRPSQQYIIPGPPMTSAAFSPAMQPPPAGHPSANYSSLAEAHRHYLQQVPAQSLTGKISDNSIMDSQKTSPTAISYGNVSETRHSSNSSHYHMPETRSNTEERFSIKESTDRAGNENAVKSELEHLMLNTSLLRNSKSLYKDPIQDVPTMPKNFLHPSPYVSESNTSIDDKNVGIIIRSRCSCSPTDNEALDYTWKQSNSHRTSEASRCYTGSEYITPKENDRLGRTLWKTECLSPVPEYR